MIYLSDDMMAEDSNPSPAHLHGTCYSVQVRELDEFVAVQVRELDEFVLIQENHSGTNIHFPVAADVLQTLQILGPTASV